MNSPVGWILPVLAGVATAVALAAGSNTEVALPAAAAAVGTAGLALARAAQRPEGPFASAKAPSPPDQVAPEMSDEWFDQGPIGQEAIVLMLDHIDRALLHPDLPNRGAVELAQLRGMEEEEFLDYVAHRLDELEAAS
jgi:hypothetical protein